MSRETASVPLTQLRVGACATLDTTQFDAEDADALRAMGLRPECRLRVCKRGEPCIVTVDSPDCRIALSKRLATKVLVRPR